MTRTACFLRRFERGERVLTPRRRAGGAPQHARAPRAGEPPRGVAERPRGCRPPRSPRRGRARRGRAQAQTLRAS